jgi:hypothetical protein
MWLHNTNNHLHCFRNQIKNFDISIFSVQLWLWDRLDFVVFYDYKSRRYHFDLCVRPFVRPHIRYMVYSLYSFIFEYWIILFQRIFEHPCIYTHRCVYYQDFCFPRFFAKQRVVQLSPFCELSQIRIIKFYLPNLSNGIFIFLFYIT